MILTIWRHGKAGAAPSDFDRELTQGGRDDITFACPAFRKMCLHKGLALPDRIVHSPWVRTAQTAAIISDEFPDAQQAVSQQIASGVGKRDVNALLEDVVSSPALPAHLLLVSHQPLVSELIDEYIGERGLVPGLSPGGLATLSLPPDTPPGYGCAQLLFWALPPTYEASV